MVNFASPLKIPKLESFQLQKFRPLTPRPDALPLDPVEGSALRPRYTLTLCARRGPPCHFSNNSCVYAMNAPGMFDCWNLDVQNDIGFDYKQFRFVSAVSAEQCDARWCPSALLVGQPASITLPPRSIFRLTRWINHSEICHISPPRLRARFEDTCTD